MGALIDLLSRRLREIRKERFGTQRAMIDAFKAAAQGREHSPLIQGQLSARERGEGGWGSLALLEQNLEAVGVDPLLLVTQPGGEPITSSSEEERLLQAFRLLPDAMRRWVVLSLEMLGQSINEDDDVDTLPEELKFDLSVIRGAIRRDGPPVRARSVRLDEDVQRLQSMAAQTQEQLQKLQALAASLQRNG